MAQVSARRVFFGRETGTVFLLTLVVYVLPPLLSGGQFLYGSPAAPVWEIAHRTSSLLGCGALSCVPLILAIFLAYTYLLAVVLGTAWRVGESGIPDSD